MKGKSYVLVILTVLIAVAPFHTAAEENNDKAEEVLQKYYEALGGLEKLQKIDSIAVNVQFEVYDYEYDFCGLRNGRFRVTESDSATIYDGNDYWQEYYGFVSRAPWEVEQRFHDVNLRNVFFHGLFDENWDPVPLEYVGFEEKYEREYDVLKSGPGSPLERQYYFNRETHLIDRIIEFQEDPELKSLKNVYKYRDYTTVDGITFFTRSEARCITNGQMIQPPWRYEKIRINDEIDAAMFGKPISTQAPAEFEDGVIVAEAIGFSERGSVITNVTQELLKKLDIENGDKMKAELKGQETEHVFFEQLGPENQIKPGDYLAIFNNSPLMWLVKAYVGMTSDMEIKKGDVIKIYAVEKKEETQKEEVKDEKAS